MISNLLFAVAFTWGVRAIFSQPFIFGDVGDFLEANLPRWLCKPFFLCVVCMGSVWGTVFYFWHGSNLFEWVVFCVSLSGINYFLINVYGFFENIQEKED